MREFHLKCVATCLLVTLVVACGGGDGGTGAASQHAVRRDAMAVTIDAEGDSLIWGFSYLDDNGNLVQSPNNPPAVLQAALQAQFGDGVAVENNGQVGAQVTDSLNGTDPYSTPFAVRLASDPAQIVLADYAANDSIGTPIDQYEAGLIEWITEVRNAGKVPVLEEPNPMCSQEFANVGAYRDAMVEVAQSQNVLLITQYDYIASLPNWQGMLMDCIHPNDDLYQIKGQREADQLAGMVQSLQ
jgi:acyl-CoA thioesterase I